MLDQHLDRRVALVLGPHAGRSVLDDDSQPLAPAGGAVSGHSSSRRACATSVSAARSSTMARQVSRLKSTRASASRADGLSIKCRPESAASTPASLQACSVALGANGLTLRSDPRRPSNSKHSKTRLSRSRASSASRITGQSPASSMQLLVQQRVASRPVRGHVLPVFEIERAGPAWSKRCGPCRQDSWPEAPASAAGAQGLGRRHRLNLTPTQCNPSPAGPRAALAQKKGARYFRYLALSVLRAPCGAMSGGPGSLTSPYEGLRIDG